MTPSLADRAGDLGQRVRWRLDRAAGTARLDNPPEGLRDFVVPVRPMLGGIGVAPDFGFAPFSAGDTGRLSVLPARPLSGPRVETADSITAIGQAGSLDEALRAATSGMVQWLAQDYGLTVAESSLVLGVAAEYRVVTLAGRNAGMALSLDKGRLADLRRRTP
jgi:acetamidase/formamidase